MKKGIVLKLFILTTTLCMFILTTIFIGQTIFFKQYYTNRKAKDIKTSIQSFEESYLNSGKSIQEVRELEKDFSQKHGTWITILDNVGNIKYNDFYVEIHSYSSKHDEFFNRSIKIPLYSFINIEETDKVDFYFETGNNVVIDGIKKEEKVIPSILTVEYGMVSLENNYLTKRLYGPSQIKPQEKRATEILLRGNVTNLNLPQSNLIYSNHVFIERIKEFQAKLIFEENEMKYNSLQELNYEENNIQYKLFAKSIKDNDGKTAYISAMTSLQPVDEAIQMIKDYYIYLIIFVVILILLVSFYYSKKIAKPLLEINDTTKKIANLDFSDTTTITSKDEIGDLSKNINELSNKLHSYIEQLQEDIEKEKKLENIRKEFIAGVSHELKTPLSVMKSCMSILKDGIAIHKKDYYFDAMEKEIDKMDMLIVDMLELAKFESGTYKMNMDIFYIDEVIEHICKQLSLEIEKKQLYVHKQLTTVQVVANQHRIEQVLTNFITNAIRYTPEKERILISTIEEENRVKICVENKGVHIPQEQLEKIWNRFYQINASRQRSKEGTGLGLAISKNILELHGVQYGVLNTEDGVLFFFYLNKNV